MQVTPGVGLLVQFEQHSGAEHALDQRAILGVAAVPPVDTPRLRVRGDFRDPLPAIAACTLGRVQMLGRCSHADLTAVNAAL